MAYLSVADVRAAVPALRNATTYPDATIERAVASFEEIAEDYRGVAYEPRTETEVFVLDCPRTTLRLTHPKVRTITSVTVTAPAVGGTPTVIAAALYTFDPDSGILSYPTGFDADARAGVIYVHGLDEPPQTLIDATLDYVRARALQGGSGVPRDAISQSVEGMTTRFSTPDKNAGRPTGYLDVDRLLNSLPDYRIPF